jgi:hypothetical protein
MPTPVNPKRMTAAIAHLMADVATPAQLEANRAAAAAGDDPESYERALERQRTRKPIPRPSGPSIMQLLAEHLNPEEDR